MYRSKAQSVRQPHGYYFCLAMLGGVWGWDDGSFLDEEALRQAMNPANRGRGSGTDCGLSSPREQRDDGDAEAISWGWQGGPALGQPGRGCKDYLGQQGATGGGHGQEVRPGLPALYRLKPWTLPRH